MALTAENRVNLEKLASYLESLPEDYQHFDMAWWVCSSSPTKVAKYARHNGGVASCGTSACAAGHGPAAGILVPPELICDGVVIWDDYCQLFVDDADGHRWCFGGCWADVDDHHYGAAARIRYLLDHEDPPANFLFGAEGFLSHYAPYRIDAKAEGSWRSVMTKDQEVGREYDRLVAQRDAILARRDNHFKEPAYRAGFLAGLMAAAGWHQKQAEIHAAHQATAELLGGEPILGHRRGTMIYSHDGYRKDHERAAAAILALADAQPSASGDQS